MTGKRRVLLLIEALFAVVFLVAAGLAVQSLLVDGPRVKAIIAHGVKLEARVVRHDVVLGKGGGQRVDLEWTTSQGARCVSQGHAVSREYFNVLLNLRSKGEDRVAILVDPAAQDCLPVLVDDLDYERRRFGPMIYVVALACLAVSIGLGLRVIGRL